MKLSNVTLANSLQRLNDILQRPLPIRVSYAINKNKNKLESELKTYNTERDKLVEKHSIKDKNGKTIVDEKNQMTPQNKNDWNKDMQELLMIENDIDIHKFKIEQLDGYDMSVNDIIAIEYMIED